MFSKLHVSSANGDVFTSNFFHGEILNLFSPESFTDLSFRLHSYTCSLTSIFIKQKLLSKLSLFMIVWNLLSYLDTAKVYIVSMSFHSGIKYGFVLFNWKPFNSYVF